MKKSRIIISLVFLIIVFSLGSIFAEQYILLCLNKGEKIEYSKCNPKMDDYVCGTTSCINICVRQNDLGFYCTTNQHKCNGLICSPFGNSSIDSEPPIMTINSPEQNGIYDSRSVLVDIELDEEGNIYYYDNINGRGRWTRVCQDCDDYSRRRSFDEGLNNLTFRAVDVMGHEVNETRTFIIDSKKPQIHKTEPRSEYASGLFEVQYTEENLEKIEIFYGNNKTGFRNASLENENCTSGKRQWCSINVDLSAYNGQRIEYYFVVADIAGNEKKSQIRQNLRVDTIYPILNNADFWDYTSGERYVYFTFNVTEDNLDKIEYELDSSGRWRVLCSRLRNGICEARKSLTRGNHNINIQITDKAGNSIGISTGEFDVEY